MLGTDGYVGLSSKADSSSEAMPVLSGIGEGTRWNNVSVLTASNSEALRALRPEPRRPWLLEAGIVEVVPAPASLSAAGNVIVLWQQRGPLGTRWRSHRSARGSVQLIESPALPFRARSSLLTNQLPYVVSRAVDSLRKPMAEVQRAVCA